MITEIIRYRIAATQAAAFESAYQRAEPLLQASANCLGYRLIRGHEEPENWILTIEWDSIEGHMQGFRKGPQFAEFFALVKPFFECIQEMKHYEAQAMGWARE